MLVHTGWDRHWGTDAYYEDHPFLTAEAAQLLVNRGAVLVGIGWLYQRLLFPPQAAATTGDRS